MNCKHCEHCEGPLTTAQEQKTGEHELTYDCFLVLQGEVSRLREAKTKAEKERNELVQTIATWVEALPLAMPIVTKGIADEIRKRWGTEVCPDCHGKNVDTCCRMNADSGPSVEGCSGCEYACCGFTLCRQRRGLEIKPQ